jgi:glycosyltransferase involved in cell wall biosynthesis
MPINPILLSIVVPVADGLDATNLLYWLNTSDLKNTQVVLVHDGTDLNLRQEMQNALRHSSTVGAQLCLSTSRNPGGARNTGIPKVTGRWIQFCDADDLPKVSAILEEIENVPGNPSLIVGQFRKIDAIKKNITFQSSTFSRSSLSEEIGIWRCIFKRDVISDVRFPNVKMGEDQIFFLKTHAIAAEVFFSEQVFYEYFIGHPTQLTLNLSNLSQLAISISEGIEIKTISEIESEFNFQIVLKLSLTYLYKTPLLTKYLPAKLVWQVWTHSGHLSNLRKTFILAKVIKSRILNIKKEPLKARV